MRIVFLFVILINTFAFSLNIARLSAGDNVEPIMFVMNVVGIAIGCLGLGRATNRRNRY